MIFHCLPPLFRCLFLLTTMRLHGKKLQNATNFVFNQKWLLWVPNSYLTTDQICHRLSLKNLWPNDSQKYTRNSQNEMKKNALVSNWQTIKIVGAVCYMTANQIWSSLGEFWLDFCRLQAALTVYLILIFLAFCGQNYSLENAPEFFKVLFIVNR
jgi:hypothetical protein